MRFNDQPRLKAEETFFFFFTNTERSGEKKKRRDSLTPQTTSLDLAGMVFVN